MDYIIIGNSAAAVGAIEGIRQIDEKGKIAVISDEPYHTYSRPLISYMLQGKTDLQKMKYRSDSFYDDMGVTALLGEHAVSIDSKHHSVILGNDRSLAYRKLLVATGSCPFVPETKGLNKVKYRFSFMRLDDARALDSALCPDSRVLIIGAGLIGLKCAEGIAQKVGSIEIVDLAPRILSSVLDEEGAKIVQEHLEAQGLKFHLESSVEEFYEDRARLKSGEEIPFDILVTAVGVCPNIKLVAEAGGKAVRGIVVDDAMRTTLEDVYAAGDCTESLDISSGATRVLALLPNAHSAGIAAGIAMAGGEVPAQKAIPMNAIGFFGLHIITAGSYKGEVFAHRTENDYKKLFYSDNRLRGYIMVGNIDKAGIYTALIREQIPLSSIDFDLVCQRPSLLAFSQRYRAENLGGKSHEN